MSGCTDLAPAPAGGAVGIWSSRWTSWIWPTGGPGSRTSICPISTSARFRARRDELFASHPQSPIPAEERATFAGLRYFDENPRAIVEVTLRPANGDLEIDTGGPDGIVRYRRVGIADTEFGSLTLWWIDAYGGGLFLPFRDGTCGRESYGGGRYLTDTIKGTHGRGVVVLDDDRVRTGLQLRLQPVVRLRFFMGVSPGSA